jgi:hypothetical protein
MLKESFSTIVINKNTKQLQLQISGITINQNTRLRLSLEGKSIVQQE